VNQPRWFQVSATKKCGGAFVFRDDGGRLRTVTVLPHFWRDVDRRTVEFNPDVEHLVLYEQDRFGGANLEGLWNELHRSGLKADTDGAIVGQGGDTAPEAPRLKDLVQRILPPGGTASGTPSNDNDHAVKSLWLTAAQLDAHAKSSGCVQVPSAFGELDWSHQVGRLAAGYEHLRKYLLVRFVLELEAVAPFLRSTYVRSTEWRKSVRGRLVTSGLVRRHTRRLVAVECEFDQLTRDDSVHRLLRKALELSASELTAPWADRAAGLDRATMQGVASVSGRHAAALARSMRPSRTNRPLQRALELAKAIVWSVDATGSEEQPDGAILSVVAINLARFWELAVVRLVGDGATDQPNPPKGREGPYPTLGAVDGVDILWGDPPRIILDCKYKDDTPSMGDRYQIYAYTDIYEMKEGDHVGLVYPQSPSASPVQPKTHDHVRGAGSPGLTIHRVPFPAGGEQLEDWLESCGPAFRESLGLKEPESQASMQPDSAPGEPAAAVTP
jgi:hypothetical protein